MPGEASTGQVCKDESIHLEATPDGDGLDRFLDLPVAEGMQQHDPLPRPLQGVRSGADPFGAYHERQDKGANNQGLDGSGSEDLEELLAEVAIPPPPMMRMAFQTLSSTWMMTI